MAAIGLLSGLIAVLSFLLFDPLIAIISCGFGLAMLAIAVSDARSFRVPDVLSLPAIPCGLLVSWWLSTDAAAWSVVAWHVGASCLGALCLYTLGVLYERFRHRNGLGLGDVKLAAVAGAWTGPDGLTAVLLLACAGALTYVLYLFLRGAHPLSGTTPVPLGTFLAPATWIVWVLLQYLSR